MMNQNEIRQKITDQIITALSDPTKLPPWRKPWGCYDANLGHPCNALTAKTYRGINTAILGLSAHERGFQSRHWLTFRQAKELGVSVKGGEKATHIVFFKPVTKKADDEGDELQDRFFYVGKRDWANLDSRSLK